jgi:hypothetical protein
VHRHAAMLLVVAGGLLLTPTAPGVPGDQTPPTVTPIVFGTLGLNGWYVTGITVNWEVRDPESVILETEGCDARTLTADSLGTRLTCRAVSDGGETTVGKTFKIDKTAPVATAGADRAADANGWYNRAVSVGFSGTDATSGLASCSAPQAYSGPDGAAVAVSGSCRDLAGNVASRSLTLAYDATAPIVSPVPGRGADVNGWYNRPLTVWFAGSDATSGVESCSSAPYVGPDNSGAAVQGTCRDRAANTAVAPFRFRYDASAPTVSGLRSKPGNRSVQLMWETSSDTTVVEVVRSPGLKGAASSLVYRGTAGTYRDRGLRAARKYRFTVTAADQAGNEAARTMAVVATGALLQPGPGERVSSPPRLVWTPVKRATYYNVQLIRGRRILSAWPARPSLRLRQTWVSNGRRHRLRPGVYRWYVWPGFGRPSQGRFGERLGGSSFVVRG